MIFLAARILALTLRFRLNSWTLADNMIPRYRCHSRKDDTVFLRSHKSEIVEGLKPASNHLEAEIKVREIPAYHIRLC